MKVNFIYKFSSVFLFFTSVTLGGCGGRPIVLARSRLLMGHVPVNVEIRTREDRRAAALEAGEGAYREAARLEGLWSEFQEGSEISCLNRRAGKGSCRLSPETMGLLWRATSFSERTGGAFDIRFLSPTEKGRRGEIEIKEATGEAYLRDPKTRLGLGAIAKGAIVEAMSAYLRDRGFPDHLINAGGDLAARGGLWEVALQIPGAPPGQFTRKEKIKDRAVSTSGNYEQGAHILDPRSGKKVLRTGAVTVIAEDPIAADALATAFFVMGKAEAEFFLKNFPGVEMIWLDAE